MNAKVKTNLNGLTPRAKLAKFKTAITACGLAPALVTTPTPLSGKSTPITFAITDPETGKSATARDFFDSP